MLSRSLFYGSIRPADNTLCSLCCPLFSTVYVIIISLSGSLVVGYLLGCSGIVFFSVVGEAIMYRYHF